MVDVTLNPQTNPEDEENNRIGAPQPQATPVAQPPKIEGAVYERPVEDTSGMAQGLAPDPYLEASGPAAQRLFQYRPEVGVFTKEPEQTPEGAMGRIDPYTEKQNKLLEGARVFYTLDKKPMTFDPNDDVQTKYRKMLRHEGGYLLLKDENGNAMFSQNDPSNPLLFPLTTTVEYNRYTQEQPETITGEVIQTVAQTFTGPTGAGDLADVDEQLKKFGMTNQIARTAALRGIATGRYSGEAVTRDLQDLGVLAASFPALAVDAVKFVSAEVIGFAAREWAGYDGEEAQQITDDIKNSGGFKTVRDIANFKNHLELQYFTEEKAGGQYSPEVIEEVFATRGLYNTAMRHAVTEGSMYATWAAYRIYGATKRMKGFNKHLEEEFGTADLAEAFETARTRDDLSPRQVVDTYITTNFSEKARKKVKRDIDIAIGMSVRKPGAARTEILREQLFGIEDQISNRLRTWKAAKAKGETEFAEREQKAIGNLRKQYRQVMHRNLVPKYMRDLSAEAGITVGAMTAANELSIQMFANQEDVWMMEAGAAVASSLQLGRFDMKENAVGLARFGSTVLAELTEGFDYVRHGNFNISQFREDMKKRGKSREALALLRNIAGQSDEYAEMFMQGLSRSAERRSELLVLSEDYGVDIDVNLFSSNLATMSGISAMMDVARQLDDNLTATGLEDIAEPIVERTKLVEDQKRLISQVSQTTRKLLDLKLGANLPDDHPVSVLAFSMRDFVTTNVKRLDDDAQYINELLNTNRERLELALRTEVVSETADGGLKTTQLLDDTYRLETENALAGISTASEMGLEVTQEQLNGVVARLDKLKQDNLDIVSKMTAGLRVGEAHTGEASGAFAHAVTTNRGRIDANVAKMYANFDANYGDVAADMSGFFDEVVLEQSEFVIGAPKELTAETAKFAKYKMIPAQKKGFAALFNGAARRTLNDVVDAQLGGDLTGVLERLELDGLPPVQQWMELRRIGREEPSLLGLDGAQGKMFAEKMPLLISPADWRAVNKQVGATLRKSEGNAQQYYFGIYDRWQEVSNPESPEAFKRGWYGGDPKNVAEEVYGEFRAAQDYYRTEVINRYNGSALTRKINGTIDQDIQSSAVRGEEEFLMEFEDVPDEMMPYYWLNEVTKEILTKNKGRTLDGMGPNGALYTTFYSKVGRLGGAYDPNTKQYYLISESDMADDAELVQVAKDMKVQLTRHLQGIVASNFKSVLPRKVGTDQVVFNPFVEIPYDREAFNSLYNIPQYKRNADGTISPILNEAGEPQMLFSEDEIFEAVSLDALERNRADLDKTFAEAEKLVDALETDLKKKYGSYDEMTAQARKDIEFNKSVFREITGGDLDAEIRAEGALPRRNTDADVAQAVYNQLVETPDFNVDRLRATLSQSGYDEAYIDATLASLVNQHLVNTTQKQTGKYTETIEGLVIERPVLELDAQKITEVLGEPGSPRRGRLESVLGDDTVEIWDMIGDTIRQVDPKVDKSGITARTSSISLDSVLSRIYNINRGVVSPQWVATESIIRASRQHGGKLLTAMLTDREVAREVLDIIQTGKVPSYKVQPEWLRVFTVQVMQAEARNEAMNEAAQMQGEIPQELTGTLSPDPSRPESNPLVQAIQTMEDPEKLRQIAEREQITPEAVKQNTQDKLLQEMQSYGFSPNYLETYKESQQ